MFLGLSFYSCTCDSKKFLCSFESLYITMPTQMEEQKRQAWEQVPPVCNAYSVHQCCWSCRARAGNLKGPFLAMLYWLHFCNRKVHFYRSARRAMSLQCFFFVFFFVHTWHWVWGAVSQCTSEALPTLPILCTHFSHYLKVLYANNNTAALIPMLLKTSFRKNRPNSTGKANLLTHQCQCDWATEIYVKIRSWTTLWFCTHIIMHMQCPVVHFQT